MIYTYFQGNWDGNDDDYALSGKSLQLYILSSEIAIFSYVIQFITEFLLDRSYSRTWKLSRGVNGGEYSTYAQDNELNVVPQHWKVNYIFTLNLWKLWIKSL